MDWKTLREKAGLTLKQLSERSKYGISTINGLEKRGVGSDRLKKQVREVLEAALGFSESVKYHAESVDSGVLKESMIEYQIDDTDALVAEVQRIKQDVAAIERIALRLRKNQVSSDAKKIIAKVSPKQNAPP